MSGIPSVSQEALSLSLHPLCRQSIPFLPQPAPFGPVGRVHLVVWSLLREQLAQLARVAQIHLPLHPNLLAPLTPVGHHFAVSQPLEHNARLAYAPRQGIALRTLAEGVLMDRTQPSPPSGPIVRPVHVHHGRPRQGAAPPILALGARSARTQRSPRLGQRARRAPALREPPPQCHYQRLRSRTVLFTPAPDVREGHTPPSPRQVRPAQLVLAPPMRLQPRRFMPLALTTLLSLIFEFPVVTQYQVVAREHGF